MASDSSWYWSDEQLVEKTASIVEAKLIGQDYRKSPTEPNLYKFSVVRVLKGPSPKTEITVKAFPKTSSGDTEYTKTCELSANLIEGKTYLVFVNGFHPRALRELDLKKTSRVWLSKIEQLLKSAKQMPLGGDGNG